MNENIAEELRMKNNSVTLFLNVLTGLLFFILKIIFYSIIPLEFIHSHCQFPKMVVEGLYPRPFWLFINVLFCFFSTLQHIQGWDVVKKVQRSSCNRSHPFLWALCMQDVKKRWGVYLSDHDYDLDFFGFLPFTEVPVSWLGQQNYYGLHVFCYTLLSIPINWINNDIFISNQIKQLLDNLAPILAQNVQCK